MFNHVSSNAAKWLYVPAEIGVREFASRLLLSCIAAERGYNVVFGKKNALARAFAWLPKGIILDKGASHWRENEMKWRREHGFRICVSEEESTVCYRDPAWFREYRISDKTLKYIDYYFAWGQGQANIITDRYPKLKSKILVTGSARMDALRSEFLSIHDEEVQNIQKDLGKFILMPSNFAPVLWPDGGMDGHRKHRAKHGNIERTIGKEWFDNYLLHKESNLNSFIEAIEHIKSRFPQHAIVIRSHPSENFSFWQDFASKLDGVHAYASKEGQVFPWLLAADGIFHHGCTTGFEAYMMGKPAIAYHPKYDERYDKELSTRIGPVAYSIQELLNLLEKSIQGQIEYKNMSWLNDFVMTEENELATDRILDHIEKIEMQTYKLVSPDRALKYFLLGLKEKTLRCIKKARHHERVNGKEPSNATIRWGNKSVDDIVSTIHKLGMQTERFKNIEVTKLKGQIFYIRNVPKRSL
jgi:surface carbohydrate biosynthesis protein